MGSIWRRVSDWRTNRCVTDSLLSCLSLRFLLRKSGQDTKSPLKIQLFWWRPVLNASQNTYNREFLSHQVTKEIFHLKVRIVWPCSLFRWLSTPSKMLQKVLRDSSSPFCQTALQFYTPQQHFFRHSINIRSLQLQGKQRMCNSMLCASYACNLLAK